MGKELEITMEEAKTGQDAAQQKLSLAEQIISQTYYTKLEQWPVVPIDKDFFESNAIGHITTGNIVCLFRVSELVYNQEKDDSAPFGAVLDSLYACGASFLMILACRDGQNELYLGAANKQRAGNANYLTNVIREILRASIEGNLPGTELKEIASSAEIEQILKNKLDNGFDSQCITAISCAAEGIASQPQGMERLLNSVYGKNFTIMLLADPVPAEEIVEIKAGYENLDTQLSSMENMSISTQRGTSSTQTLNWNKTISENLSKSITYTQSKGSSYGWSKGTTQGKGGANSNVAGALGAAAVLSVITAGASDALKGAGYVMMNAVNSLLPASTTQDGTSEGTTNSQNKSESTAEGKSEQQGRSEQTGTSVAGSQSESMTFQYTVSNQHIHALRKKTERYLEWLEQYENCGMFRSCTYVLSESPATNLLVASQYQALVQNQQKSAMPSAINTWTKQNGVKDVREYLMHMNHPFITPSALDNALDATFSPAKLSNSSGLVTQIALPQQSVVGISVMEYTPFGCEAKRSRSGSDENQIQIGHIVHMGKMDENLPVSLDLQSLASHTFIAGTNGSGKSNAIYKILIELKKKGLPFMVIEPAKGEYKNVFGKEADVYGTNPTKTALLQINPFYFNEGTYVREHIENLMGVFNASWSMYDAMSSILRSSVENTYKACGWDLRKSACKNPKGRVFPTVKDLLEQFNIKLNSTAFAKDVKSNYVGALSTRLESLCTGICGELFNGKNLDDSALFEKSVIIDLSRAGASETKSMIMGIMLIRLQEYRMSMEEMNLPLQHITVLEEAHHLLKKTSLAQSDDHANLAGKSVEMLSNAIAEMRSKGEGFIIADQAPGLMDTSVIRNTNTKIALRLPESGDREKLGAAMGLNPGQIYEISRLKTGVCAIYQKDWLEAVLCCIDRADTEEIPYQYIPPQEEYLCFEEDTNEEMIEARTHAFSYLFSKNVQELSQDTVELLAEGDTFDRALGQTLEGLLRMPQDSKEDFKKATREPVAKLLANRPGLDLYAGISEDSSPVQWDEDMRRKLSAVVSLDGNVQTSLMKEMLLSGQAHAPKGFVRFYYNWLDFINQKCTSNCEN